MSNIKYGYLCNLDGEKVFVVAENIAGAFDILAEVAPPGKSYGLAQASSINIVTNPEAKENTPTDAEIEAFVLKIMEQDPKKAASWMTLIAGRECVKSNAAELVIELDADMPDGKRYNIVNTIKISDTQK